MSADWPYDARQDDPLTELRIPVVDTIRPDRPYLVALCVNENPEWDAEKGMRPDDLEVAQIRSLLGFLRGQYRPGWISRGLDSKPFDMDDTGPNITLIKRNVRDWAYRHSTWNIGYPLAPAPTEVPVDLPGLLDRMAYGKGNTTGNPKWDQWKAGHRSVFEPGACGDPACTAFEWSLHNAVSGVDGSVLLCTTHQMPAPGWAYN